MFGRIWFWWPPEHVMYLNYTCNKVGSARFLRKTDQSMSPCCLEMSNLAPCNPKMLSCWSGSYFIFLKPSFAIQDLWTISWALLLLSWEYLKTNKQNKNKKTIIQDSPSLKHFIEFKLLHLLKRAKSFMVFHL